MRPLTACTAKTDGIHFLSLITAFSKVKAVWRTLLLAVMMSVLLPPLYSQVQVYVSDPVEIAKATGNGYMQFPRGYGFDIKDGNGKTVRKVFASWATNADGAPASNQHIISTNGGQSYGAVSPSSENPVNFTTIIRMNSGNMVSIPFKPTAVTTTTYSFTYYTSSDNGETWTQHTDGAVNFDALVSSLYFHRGAFEEDGILYAPVYASRGYGFKPWILQSADGGATWTLKTESVGAALGTTEPTLARCANGDWLVVYRVGDNQPLKYSRSTDKGATWSAADYLPGLGSASTSGDDLNESVDPCLQLMPNGVMVLSYGRPNLHVAISEDGNGYNWTNKTTTFTEVPGTLGKRTTGYSGLVSKSTHSFWQIGDTGADWTYGTSHPSPNPFSIWQREIQLITSRINRIDLSTKQQVGAVTVMPATTLTYTNAAHPETGATAAFDGSVDYWSSAIGSNSGVLQLDLQKVYYINAVGIALLQGIQQSATVELSKDAVNWTTVKTYTNTRQYSINYTNITTTAARYVRVAVSGTGQVGLGELELYQTGNSFDANAVDPTTNPHGILPAGYTWAGTSSTRYGASVNKGVGYQSSCALKLYDGSSTWQAGVKKITSPSNKKVFQFRCRPAAIPSGGCFIWTIRGTVSGVESTVFYFLVGSDGKIKANNGSGWTQVGTATLPVSATNWKLITMIADRAANKDSLFVDGVFAGVTTMYANPANTTNLTGFAFASNGTATWGEVVYLDDIDFYDPVANPVQQPFSRVSQSDSAGIALPTLSLAPTLVNSGDGLALSIAPNPAGSRAMIQVKHAKTGRLYLSVTNTAGNTVQKMKLSVAAGGASVPVALYNLPAGIYYITVQQQDQRAQAKLSILR